MIQTTTSDKSKKFDDWKDVVDCNDCGHYWDNSCDGVKTGSSKPCTAFIATRSVVLPSKIKRLESAIKWLKIAVIGLSIFAVGMACGIVWCLT